MTTTEFSQAFDTQISTYSNNTDFGNPDKGLTFDEYEKSVFLTRAQDELIISLYSGKNPYNEGFEITEEIRRYLSSLVTTAEQSELTELLPVKVHKDSHFFSLPDDLWFITYEAIKTPAFEDTCMSSTFVEVQPVTQDELHRIIKNPFRGPNKRRAIRLDISGGIVEIITPLTKIANYTVRYIKEPSPIIVDNLLEDIDIKEKNVITECTLHPALHKAILDRAVQLAISSKAFTTRNK